MEALFLKVLNMSISAVWLILAVVIFRFVLKGAPKAMRVVLWGLAALRLVIPFSIESVLSLIPSKETVPDNFALMTEPSIDSGVEVIDRAVNTVINNTLAPADVTASVNPMQIVMFVCSAVWLAGIALMLVYVLVSFFVLRRSVGASINTQENVYVCDGISGPFILGVIRPRIYIPSNLTEEQKSHVLAHERAHLKRMDHLWKPLGFLILAVHWFNPAVWVAYVLLCRDIEFACDERVIKNMNVDDIKAYSQTLLNCSVTKKMITACPVAFGEVGVKNRIKTVLNYKKPMFWVILAAIAVCVATAVFFLTNPPAEVPDISGKSGVTDEGNFWFEAVIIEKRENGWMVRPCEGTNERNTSDKIFVSKNETNGLEDYLFEKNSLVRIYYDGMIQELYPAVIPNVSKIVLVEKTETVVYGELKSAVAKYVADEKDGIFTNALNGRYLNESNAPVHSFNSYSEMKEFVEKYAEDGSGKDITEKFDENYFEENALYVIYVRQTNRRGCILSGVRRSSNTLLFEFTPVFADSDEPLKPECLMIAVGIKKTAVEGCEYFYAEVEADSLLEEYNKPAKAGNVSFVWKTYGMNGGKDVVESTELDKYLVDDFGRKLYKFDSYSDLQSVGHCFSETYGHPRSSLTPKMQWYHLYDENYFKTKTLLFIYIASPSGSFSYEIDHLKIDKDGNAALYFVANTPTVHTDDMAYYGIAVEVEKSALRGVKKFILNESDTEKRSEQKNIVSILPPEELKDVSVWNYRTQITGVLDRGSEVIFTNALNKEKLNAKDSVHLPVHIVSNETEFNELMSRYSGIASMEIPDGLSVSMHYRDVTYDNKNMAVAIVYIDPTMAAKGEYNAIQPVIENGKITFRLLCDNWYHGGVDLTRNSMGWIVAISISKDDLKGISEFDAVAYQTMEEYASVKG